MDDLPESLRILEDRAIEIECLGLTVRFHELVEPGVGDIEVEERDVAVRDIVGDGDVGAVGDLLAAAQVDHGSHAIPIEECALVIGQEREPVGAHEAVPGGLPSILGGIASQIACIGTGGERQALPVHLIALHQQIPLIFNAFQYEGRDGGTGG